MFNHVETQPLPTLSRETVDGKRMYLTESGLKYPSVTTVLGARNAKAIYEWRQRVGEKKANAISTRASARGTKIHGFCEKYLCNESVDTQELNLVEQDMWNDFKPVLDRIDNIQHIESFLYSDHLRMAGQVDCIAELDGKPTIIDFKTSSKPKYKSQIASYFAQCAAYAIMYEERTGIAINRTAVLISVQGEQPQVYIEKRDNYVDYLIESRDLYESKQ